MAARMSPVSDPRVWRSVRTLYVGSGILFLATIALGVLNAFTDGDLPRGQVLAHFHSGTIGWVTLSVVATSLWVFTGQRAVGDRYAGTAWLLAWTGIVAVAGYVVGFYLAFNGQGPFWLLPLFGIPAWLVIVGAFLLTAVELRRQEVVTTPHLLLLGALLVASLGATMGVLVGLSHAGVVDVFPADGNGVGAHAGPMDMYLALAFAAVAEMLLVDDRTRRWSKPGMTQAVLGVTSGFVASLSLFAGIGPLVPVALLLFLVAFGFYVGRVGWRVFTRNPLRRPALWWGGVALPVYVLLFVYLVAVYFSQDELPPHLLEVVFVHTTFVAMATNLLLAVQATFAPAVMPRLLTAGVWTTNLGLLVFFAGEVAAGAGHGALVMGAGIVMALWAVWAALGRAKAPGRTKSAAA